MTFVRTDILNPYSREIISHSSYPKLIDFLQDVYPKGFERPTDISINGIMIEIDDYDIALNDNDVIVLLDRSALPVGLIGGWFITALANLAISVALSYVANKLFAPDSPADRGQPSSVYNLNSAQNMARFGSPIPIIYGKVRMFPSMIVQPYYKFEDNIEYLYHVLCVGQGTLTTDKVYIAEDEINSTDLDWKLLYPDSFFDIPSNGYGFHITKTLSNPSNMEIKIADGESERYTISKDAQYVEVDYMYPNGLIRYESDGGDTSGKTSFTIRIYNVLGVLQYSEEKYINARSIDPIQTTWKKDISSFTDDISISFEKTYGVASNTNVTNTFIKRVKAIYPNEDFTERYGDITLLTCKIKATNAVSSAGQVKVNGYFTRTDVGNTMDEVLTDIYTNQTYGGALSSGDLNFPITTETVNCAYEENITIFDAMRKPALAQGYSIYLAGMDVILKKDAPNEVTTAMYNEMNILSNSLKVQYLFKEEYPSYDGFECTFIDGNGWNQKSSTYPSYSTRPQVVDLFGVVYFGDVYSGFGLSEASYDNVSYSVLSQDNAGNSIAFNIAGTKMYMVGTSTAAVYQYTLSTAWDLNTITYDGISFYVGDRDIAPTSIAFNHDGSRMYVLGAFTKYLYQYTLDSPFVINTATYYGRGRVGLQDPAPMSVYFNPDGSKMYVAGRDTDTVYQYTLSTAWFANTAVYDNVSFYVGTQDQFPQSIGFNNDGTKMYMVGHVTGAARVYQYALSTAWDLSTASYDVVSFYTGSQDTIPTSIAFDTYGTKMYILGATGDKVYQYSLQFTTVEEPSSIMARYLYNQEESRRKIVTFQTDIQGLIPQFLDKIMVSHSALQWGEAGEVMSRNVDALVLSDKLTDLTAGKTIVFRNIDGSVSSPYNVIITDEYNISVTGMPAWVTNGIFYTIQGMGTAKEFTVISVKPSGDTVSIDCVNYDPTIYE